MEAQHKEDSVRSGAYLEGAIRRKAALAAMVAVSLAASFQFGALLQRANFAAGFAKVEFSMKPDERQRYADLRSIVGVIPQNASVAATESA